MVQIQIGETFHDVDLIDRNQKFSIGERDGKFHYYVHVGSEIYRSSPEDTRDDADLARTFFVDQLDENKLLVKHKYTFGVPYISNLGEGGFMVSVTAANLFEAQKRAFEYVKKNPDGLSFGVREEMSSRELIPMGVELAG